ncbi:glycosyltransferase family 24 protein [Neolentinus lepideus HHB14362 ss-1]|uniref:Glycosyltransferase family 24 protein n=1 Tax=Neolentinus lepideus HHB14362 ss-1 TaxID=1314782 RepID=A0A165S9K7_9AGAM|nr:glycosyltransferase family 24 protein [Neolentinus lepideus HHB14362 ss-1]
MKAASVLWTAASLNLVWAILSPPVKVSLRTSWSAPCVLLEVIETVSLENPNAFVPLLDVLTKFKVSSLPSHATAEATYEYVLSTAVSEGLLQDSSAKAVVEMNTALHAATPKIEAAYQYYLDRHGEQTEGCRAWVDWYSHKVYDVETLAHFAGHETIDSSNKSAPTMVSRPKLLPFDHIYPPRSHLRDPPPHTAIFYASPSMINFRDLHEYLFSLATEPIPRVEYVFRHMPPCVDSGAGRNHSHLSGYGVAMDLKKMDYLALDDRRATSQGDAGGAEREGDVADVITADPVVSLLQQYPENFTADSNTPLNEEELLEIGVKATQLVMNSSDPLSTLKHLSQNFPKYATSIARRVIVNESLLEEVGNNQYKAQPGISAVWLNGNPVSEIDMNPFGLLKLLRKERALVTSLTSLGLTPTQALDLLTHPAIATAQGGSDVLDGIFDASDRPEGGDVIVWWNDLEKDGRYARWSPLLRTMLRPIYPGSYHNVKLNLWNVVLVMDLSQTSSLNFLSSTVSNIIQRNFPFRFGVVPAVESEEGKKMARLFYWLVKNYGRAKTMGFMRKISQLQVHPQHATPTVNWNTVREEFAGLVSSEEPPTEDFVPPDLEAVLEATIESNSQDINAVAEYSRRLGATLSASPSGHAFVNGKHYDLDDDFLRHMQIEVGAQLQHIQEKVYIGEITDADAESVSTYFYDLPSTAKRRHSLIYPAVSTSNKPGSLQIRSLPEVFARAGKYIDIEGYLHPPGDSHLPLTTYAVADFDTPEGLALIKELLQSMDETSLSRVSFIHNPSIAGSPSWTELPVSTLLSYLIQNGLLHKVTPHKLMKVLGLGPSAVQEGHPQIVISNEDALDELIGGLDAEVNAEAYNGYVDLGQMLVKEFGLPPGKQALVVNGRIIGPITDTRFLADDLRELYMYEMRKRVEPVFQALQEIIPDMATFDRGTFADIVSLASSIVSAMQIPDPSEAGLFNAAYKPRTRNYRLMDGNFTRFEVGDAATALHQFGVVLDPLSEAAQKWSSLFEWLSHIGDVFFEVYVHPAGYREIPLKRFYRYNLLPKLSFDANGHELQTATTFQDLPLEPIYTLSMDVPPAWLVRPREAQHDLDNIQLGTMPAKEWSRGVEAVFDLDYLVIEGHARDPFTNAPPRGLQLQLTVGDSTPVADTLVVANLGYLQFRAKPGVFQLEIRDGRGREIFDTESVGNEGWDSPSVSEVGNEVALTSFEGSTLYPRFARKPGMERMDVLEEFDNSLSGSGDMLHKAWSIITSFFAPKPQAPKFQDVQARQAEINIFTVASGLLYERFSSIMVLSVLRNTNSTVKFWFIENFLSPSFLEFIPHFAQAYNFQYELVTYKWPSWLRAQKEKQRIIWAYKILFLDVLFPMDLKKVIFVDADQIVRTDLKELVDLDLHGAPYGYTPMGDDNVEMEGFRFWKTGYWKDFLQGRPYHISALYVVDLVRFRQMAAGDILRGHYQQLSADPGSLANLDQDLPNNLQREVPIFSLHEDWLWCETWCSKDRLHRAKTIDLCQNPLTKEPKLARARQIPEWEEYDAEISRFARNLAEDGLIRSDIATAGADVLASVAAGAAAPVVENADLLEKPEAETEEGSRVHEEL